MSTGRSGDAIALLRCPRPDSAGSANEAPGEFPSERVVTYRLDSRDDGVEIPASRLDQPWGASGKVVGHLSGGEAEILVVDDVDISALTDRDRTSIAETEEIGGLACLSVDHVLEG